MIHCYLNSLNTLPKNKEETDTDMCIKKINVTAESHFNRGQST